MRRWITIAVLLALVVLVVPMMVTAQGEVIEGDRAIFGRTFVLESGQTMRGDLAVMGGSVRIEEGALLSGDLSVVGGSVTVSGEIEGDVAIFGGSVRLEESAVVQGDLASIGGSVQRAPGARIGGESVEGFDFNVPPVVIPPFGFLEGGVAQTERGIANVILGILGFIIRVVLTTLALAALAFVVALFIPQQTRRVGDTAAAEPLLSFGIGCLSMPVALLVGIFLVITIIGIPVAGLLGVAMFAAWLFGLIGLGFVLGHRMLRSADIRSPRPTAAAVAGIVVLSLAWTLVDVIPCLDFVVGIIISSLALGAVILSRFGTARFPSSPESVSDEPLLGPMEPFEPAESRTPPSSPAPPAPPMDRMMDDIAAEREETEDDIEEASAEEPDDTQASVPDTEAPVDEDVSVAPEEDVSEGEPPAGDEADADERDAGEGPEVPPERWS